MQLALKHPHAPSTGTAAISTLRPAVCLAALLSFASGWVHLAYTESHFRAWWAYGVFFLAVGLGQALFGATLLRWPSRWLALAGIAANLGVVAMYVVSRTIGVPVGPEANVAHQAKAVDLLTTAGEIVLVGVLLGLLGRTARRRALNVILVLGVLLWTGRLTGYLP
jgi:hypothetical protein